MRFTEEFDREVLRGTAFEGMADTELRQHLKQDRYGDFLLTEAIRPSPQFSPIEGYRFDTYRDESGSDIPVIMAAASREKLFDVFMQLSERVGKMVYVTLTSTHDKSGQRQSNMKTKEWSAEDVETMIAQSHLCDFEQDLLNDGCAGIAIYRPRVAKEVQLDEHKLLLIYAETRADLRPFERILRDEGVRHRQDMKFITESEHIHSSDDTLNSRFYELSAVLGCEEDID